MTKKEENANRMKERICTALLSCLSEEPFRKITVKKIITKASINRTTFYKYFLDKYDLLEYYLDQIMEEFKSEKNFDFVKAHKEEINNPVYSDYFRNSEEFIKRNSMRYRILWSSEIGSNLYENMLESLKSNILDTMLTDPLYTQEKQAYAVLYSNLFANNFMATLRWWIERNDIIEFGITSDLMKGNMEKGIFQTYRDIMENHIESSNQILITKDSKH